VLAEAVVEALNGGRIPRVHVLGSLGQADLAQNADLAAGVLQDIELAPGDAVALLVGNAFSTGQAALAVADTRSLLEWIDVAGALDFEAFRANVGALHPAVADARPYPGLRATVERMHALLEGSGLWESDAARFLQDPLTFRCLPQLHGAFRDALAFVEQQLEVELNAHQGNPLVIEEEGRLVSVGNFDSQPLAASLDFLRIALAPVLTASVERALKLLSPRFSGLSEGLVAGGGSWQDGLSELGVAAQAVAAEARLLAHPVSFELVSTMQESGVEDRATLGSLGARRLWEMLDLGARVLAVELVVAAQAVDLRAPERLGAGAAAAHARVREQVPFLDSPEQMPLPLEDLARDVRSRPCPT
jgi:histidine ammonia-lyase